MGTSTEQGFVGSLKKEPEPDVESVGMVDFTRLGIWETPTVVVTDRSKLVRGVWYGRLQPSVEDEVFQ